MGRMKGFELSTSGTTNQRSNQLSYIRHALLQDVFIDNILQSQANFTKIFLLIIYFLFYVYNKEN